MKRIYELFISHVWSKSGEYKNLVNLLDCKKYTNFNYHEVPEDSPINSDNSEYIKSVLRKRLDIAEIVLVPAHVSATNSDWVIWEMDTAEKNNVPIIGIKPYGGKNISMEVTSRAKECVNWNTKSIVDAIRKHAISR
ncbi:MAG: hypothetical protein C4617_02260 [Candidatus Liberibacter europaeus]|uniref:Thoeris protein ThsB TIR-like domain-containing protein n=1 Tax=Candidatus Liberibacter europaeus TaxID=744859 RepID=A0A2T4VY09_9HYPH|nr:hypothetical protein [Candidatus Liberibacter europaeus]PTL86662.1 MAG: hypothetical protein C4617_02260 [Candidatus Liberibacter europaeus]